MKAFPQQLIFVGEKTDGSYESLAKGMDLRDYFAAQAMTGAQIWDAVLNGKNPNFEGNGAVELAKVSYAIADAMMKAREVK